VFANEFPKTLDPLEYITLDVTCCTFNVCAIISPATVKLFANDDVNDVIANEDEVAFAANDEEVALDANDELVAVVAKEALTTPFSPLPSPVKDPVNDPVLYDDVNSFRAFTDASEPVMSEMSTPLYINDPVILASCINII